jgi:hypothetical protein
MQSRAAVSRLMPRSPLMKRFTTDWLTPEPLAMAYSVWPLLTIACRNWSTIDDGEFLAGGIRPPFVDAQGYAPQRYESRRCARQEAGCPQAHQVGKHHRAVRPERIVEPAIGAAITAPLLRVGTLGYNRVVWRQQSGEKQDHSNRTNESQGPCRPRCRSVCGSCVPGRYLFFHLPIDCQRRRFLLQWPLHKRRAVRHAATSTRSIGGSK